MKIVIIYSPSCCSKPVFIMLNMKEDMLRNAGNQTFDAPHNIYFPTMEVNGYQQLFGSLKYLLMC